MPSTVAPGVVLEAGARTEPCSSGMPSGPIPPAVVCVPLALPLLLVELEELDPQPAARSEAQMSTSVHRRAFTGSAYGSGHA